MPARCMQIYDEMTQRVHRRADRMFCWLFLAQWCFAIAVAIVRTPWTWTGAQRSVHPHVFAAVLLGGTMCAIPVVLIRTYPGRAVTRHVVAAVQMLWSALLILLMGGRIEAHFHVFGSLAFLAFYRDWRVLVTATLTLAADHLTRGLAWPDSVYGVANPEWWRFLEHAAWVAFEDVVLVVGCVRATREMYDAAIREATLQQTALTIQRKVENRTHQLKDNAERYRLLVENTEAMPFEYDVPTRRLLYIAPNAAKMLECTPAELLADGILEDIAHPVDREVVRAKVAAFVRGERAASEPIDHRMITKQRRTIHVRTFLSSCSGTQIRGILLDITRQVALERELRHAQKLESVGRIAAGVAHEINTPIQFVSDSLEFTREAVVDLLAVVAAQQQTLDAIRTGERSTALSDLAAESVARADLPYLVAQLPRAIDRALEGTRRVAVIVQSMRVFAHDKREMTEVDLREAVESTLTIASNEYKYIADLELRLEAVPRVTCLGGEINQVILNILVNAAQAIGEVVADSERRGKIIVALRQVEASVVISITDTGRGIPEQDRDHIFEQFYTTKPVGKGTGLGLSMCRSAVVDKHRGSLTFETETGVGTTFHIRLPISQPSGPAPSPAG